MTCRSGLAPVAALALLVSAAPAGARIPETLDGAWEQALAHAGRPAQPIVPRLQLLAAEGLVLDPETPAVRSALEGALAQRGVPDGERGVVLDALVRGIRLTLGSARIVGIGPLEMTRADVAAIAGPRQGRDRALVVARLRSRVPAASALSDDEATALVPAIVRMADSSRADAALERVVAEILGNGSEQ